MIGIIWNKIFLFPCRMRYIRFYVNCRISLSSSSPPFIYLLSIAVGLAGSPLPVLDRSGLRQTSIVNSGTLCAVPPLPALDRSLIPITNAQSLRASPDFYWWESDRCGPRRISIDENLRTVGLTGLQPQRIWALWASADFNRRDAKRCGPRRTSTGPERTQIKPHRMPKRIPDRMSKNMSDRNLRKYVR